MAGPDYGFWARVLHRFALAGPVSEMSFNIDRMLHASDPETARLQKHVFVCGLARAGTTALMRKLYATGEFCSLTYRDMPFALAPHFWRKLTGFSSREADLNERAHGDGILVDFDSPEALEEVFWRVLSGRKYIFSDRLAPMEADSEVIESFVKYIAALLDTSGSSRYLSKNNNNILRLSSLRVAFPEAAVIIPFRDPIQQSLSLYNQHLRFAELHRRDGFARKYMQWLVHHEFGGDHRPFDVGGSASEYSPGTPAYWLDQWIRVYSYLLRQTEYEHDKILFVEYERLCDSPETTWKAIAGRTGLPMTTPGGFSLSKPPARNGLDADKKTTDLALGIYCDMQSRFESMLR